MGAAQPRQRPEQQQRDRQQHGGLDREPVQRPQAGADALLEQPIERERHRQRESDDRHLPAGHREKDRRHQADRDGHPLQAAQGFAQQHDAEGHGDEWVEEVAERSVPGVSAQHRSDVDPPVDRDEQGRGSQPREQPRTGEQRPHPRHVPTPSQDDQAEEQAPQDPVSQHLKRRRRGQPMEVEGEEPPQHVCRGAEECAASNLGAWVEGGGHPPTVQVSRPASSAARSASVAGPPAASTAAET
ncbi:MAG: hypothetical protein BWY91_01569 [bacterium ADurb.BinA028]|nr:MAG: hypothetical protein BWY91_01569 [bacterium ADurb.BinA028]